MGGQVDEYGLLFSVSMACRALWGIVVVEVAAAGVTAWFPWLCRAPWISLTADWYPEVGTTPGELNRDCRLTPGRAESEVGRAETADEYCE